MYDDARCMRDVEYLIGELRIDPIKEIRQWNQLSLMQQAGSLWCIYGSTLAKKEEDFLRPVQFLMHYVNDADLRNHCLDQPLRQQFVILKVTFLLDLGIVMNTQTIRPAKQN